VAPNTNPGLPIKHNVSNPLFILIPLLKCSYHEIKKFLKVENYEDQKNEREDQVDLRPQKLLEDGEHIEEPRELRILNTKCPHGMLEK
jgi:hypothetical protein